MLVEEQLKPNVWSVHEQSASTTSTWATWLVHEQLHPEAADHIIPLRMLYVFGPSPAPVETFILIKIERIHLIKRMWTLSGWPSQVGCSWTEAKRGGRRSGLDCGTDNSSRESHGEKNFSPKVGNTCCSILATPFTSFGGLISSFFSVISF